MIILSGFPPNRRLTDGGDISGIKYTSIVVATLQNKKKKKKSRIKKTNTYLLNRHDGESLRSFLASLVKELKICKTIHAVTW